MIQGQSVVHYVTYPQSPQRVWRALVDPEELALWLMPNDFVPEVGRRFTMDGGEPVGRIQGEVLEVEPERRLSCRWTGKLGDTVVTFELTPTAAGTLLRLEHSGWSDQDKPYRDLYAGGWTGKLSDRLRRVLEGRPADKHAGAEASSSPRQRLIRASPP
jgi:uncharacterized protein YndB with AHSA1/START domain